MLRTIIFGCALWAVVSTPASACLAFDFFEGIAFYNAPPEDAQPDELVLDVSFGDNQVATLNGVVTARVRRVLQGDYSSDVIRVGLGNSSCTVSFVFGRKGVIVGRLVTPTEGQEIARGWPAIEPVFPGSEQLVFAWPFQETVFLPRAETVEAYAHRTGMDPARLYHGSHLASAPRISIAGDFDGDGREDVASFTRGGVHPLIAVVLTSKPTEVFTISPSTEGERYDLSVAAPGKYLTDCAALSACLIKERPRAVQLRNNGFIVTDFSGWGDILYFWDGRTFEPVRIEADDW